MIFASGRSDVFEKMFAFDNVVKQEQGAIEIKDSDSESFTAFLKFIYCGRIDNLDDNALNLLKLADKVELKLHVIFSALIFT